MIMKSLLSIVGYLLVDKVHDTKKRLTLFLACTVFSMLCAREIKKDSADEAYVPAYGSVHSTVPYIRSVAIGTVR